LLPLLFRSSLPALLREKRDLKQFLRHEREECGCGPLRQLQTYCAAELWEEASQQYQQMQADRRIHRAVLTPYLARIRVGRGQYGKVLKMVEQEVEPLRILLPAVRTYLHLGQPERAAALVAEARRKKDPDAVLAMGELQEAAGNLAVALERYEQQAHSLCFYRHAPAHRAVGRVLMRLERYAEASRALEQAIRLDYFLRREDVENLAECLRRLGKCELTGKAEAALARCGERTKE
jgi:tetratricopeptide (TPR) repeat protein